MKQFRSSYRLRPVLPLFVLMLFTLYLPITAQESDTVQQKLNVEDTIKLPKKAKKFKKGKNGELVFIKFVGKSLAVVDLRKRELKGVVTLAETSVRFAAGRSRLLVYYPGNQIFELYDVENMERTSVKQSPFSGVIDNLVMGSATDSFAMIRVSESSEALATSYYRILSLPSLKPKNENKSGTRFSSHRDDVHHRMAPSGTFFTSWQSGVSPSGLQSCYVDPESGALRCEYRHDTVGHILPLPGKEMAVCGNGEVISADTNVVRNHDLVLYPDQTGHFYVGAGDQKLNVFTTAGHEKIASLPNPRSKEDAHPMSKRFTSKTMFFHSSLKLAWHLSRSKKKVVLRKFNPVNALKSSGRDYLLVISTPPDAVEPGETLEYKPKVLTNSESWEVNVMSSPDGVELKESTLTWEVPRDMDESKVEILIEMKGSNGSKQFQTINLNIKGVEPTPEQETY